MWIVLPAISLAIVHIAGDNIGVVPDSAASLGTDVFPVTILAYMVFGSIITGLSAWIGAYSGCELGVLVYRLFGGSGKKAQALVILAVCIPASALTGGYFAGWLLHMLTGLPNMLSALICIVGFSVLAAGYCEEGLAIANYTSLLLMPVVMLMTLLTDWTVVACPVNWEVDWQLVLALFGYNAGGMRPILVAEAAAYWRKKGYKAVFLAVAAKIMEGIATLVMAWLVLSVGSQGPLALAAAAKILFGPAGGMIFGIILFCVFVNTMTPAMAVNARQLSNLTGIGFGPAIVAAAVLVYITTLLEYQMLLSILSITGLTAAAFIIYTASCLHKYAGKQQ